MSPRSCDNCAFREVSETSEPCASCLRLCNWAEGSDPEHTCDTCVFWAFPKDYLPCRDCEEHHHIRWTDHEPVSHPERMAEPRDNPANDNVNHPAHYTQGGIECIDAIKAAVVGLTGIEAVCTGQVIKYIWRWKHKNGIEDLRKAEWYLHRLINEVETGELR